VPKKKRLAAVAAQTAMANAAFWAGMFTWPIAGGWYGVAHFNGEIAKDPPKPECNPDEVEVTELPLPRGLDEEARRFPETVALLRAAARLAALENARTVSRSRMMGARLTGEGETLRRQQDGYARIEREMSELSARLGEILRGVQREVEEEPRLHRENLEPLLRGLAREGLSEEMRRGLEEAGLSTAEVNGLAATLRDREFIELASANGLFLASFVGSLQDFVQEVRGDREAVLAGEEYVHVAERERRRQVEEPEADLEATPRREKR
jgi:hypothetical protein